MVTKKDKETPVRPIKGRSDDLQPDNVFWNTRTPKKGVSVVQNTSDKGGKKYWSASKQKKADKVVQNTSDKGGKKYWSASKQKKADRAVQHTIASSKRGKGYWNTKKNHLPREDGDQLDSVYWNTSGKRPLQSREEKGLNKR
jgi:hypothetical protein